MDLEHQIQGGKLMKTAVQGIPKNLVVLRDNSATPLFHAYPFVEAFNAERGTHLKVVSHMAADAARKDSKSSKKFPAFAAVDASIAYEKPGTALGKNIVFSAKDEPRVVLETGKFEGEKDVALVAIGLNSKDFAYTISGKSRTLHDILQAYGIEILMAIDFKTVSEIQLLVPDNKLILVPDFPNESGWWYVPHAETGVPHSKIAEVNSDSRSLYRLGDSSYVGLVVRLGEQGDFFTSQCVNVATQASQGLGLVAEVPEDEVPIIERFIAQVAGLPHIESTTIKIPAASPRQVESLIRRFGEDLKVIEQGTKAELLEAAQLLNSMFSRAKIK